MVEELASSGSTSGSGASSKFDGMVNGSGPGTMSLDSLGQTLDLLLLRAWKSTPCINKRFMRNHTSPSFGSGVVASRRSQHVSDPGAGDGVSSSHLPRLYKSSIAAPSGVLLLRRTFHCRGVISEWCNIMVPQRLKA